MKSKVWTILVVLVVIGMLAAGCVVPTPVAVPCGSSTAAAPGNHAERPAVHQSPTVAMPWETGPLQPAPMSARPTRSGGSDAATARKKRAPASSHSPVAGASRRPSLRSR